MVNRIDMSPMPIYIAEEERNCCRCGRNFAAYDRERVCPQCKRPSARDQKVDTRGLPLSPREKQVVGLVVKGHLNKQIAFAVRLTEGTIKEYLNRIFRKVGASNRTELAVWALTNGVIGADDRT
jgi:DNA-binding NarL/FixJ family response regulator